MVVTHFAATAPATGKSAAMDVHRWWRFRDAKIYLYRGTEDTARKSGPPIGTQRQRALADRDRRAWPPEPRKTLLLTGRIPRMGGGESPRGGEAAQKARLRSP
jgi:hypothetical protein